MAEETPNLPARRDRDEKGRLLPGHQANTHIGGAVAGVVYLKTAFTSLLKKNLAEVAAIADDPQEAAAYRLAAQRICIAARYEQERSDRVFDQVADRSEGRPRQSTDITVEQVATPEDLVASIRKDLGYDRPMELPNVEPDKLAYSPTDSEAEGTEGDLRGTGGDIPSPGTSNGDQGND